METERRNAILEYGKLFVTLSALVGLLLFTGAPRVKASEAECQHRTEKADHKLHEAIKHHSYESKEVERARHELQKAREYCWAQEHKWYDVDGHEWRTERNWDDAHGRP